MTDTSTSSNFWKSKKLEEMTSEEWESLCDRCGRCCLNKLEMPDGEIFFTDLACSYLDRGTCTCRDYPNRLENVPDCVSLDPSASVYSYSWLPSTCAYRLLDEGKKLSWWHPLVSGSYDTVHEAGISVRGRCSDETGVPIENYESHIIDWIPSCRRESK